MPTRPAWSYQPALDGVRAIAVYLVVLFHSGLLAVGGGFIGVDLFFVLSGFLITNVLLNDMDEYGRIRFGRFYARRARRLLPAALVVAVVTSLTSLLVASVVERLSFVRDAQSALLYVANWHFLGAQNDYFATGVSRSPFLHFWSLSIEEQFYLLFPLLLLCLLYAGRRRPRLPLLGLLVLCALSVVAQVLWSTWDPNHAYYGTDTRAYQLLAGAVVAYTLRRVRFRLTVRAADAAAAVALVAVGLLGSGLLNLAVSTRGLGATAAGSILVAALVLRDDGRTARLLSHRSIVHLGRISYGTYLWHWPVLLVLRDAYGLNAVGSAVGGGIASTGLAALSYRWLEMPVRRSRALDRVRWPTVAAGVALCTLVAIAVVPPILSSARRPVVSAAHHSTPVATSDAPAPEPPPPADRYAMKADRQRVPAGLDWPALVDDTGPARTCDASAVQRCVVVRGTGPHILLVGDSHARMLAPMLIRLAREHGLTLSMNVVASCPWQARLATLWQSAADQRTCDQSRDVWYREVLPKLHPDVVVLAEYTRDAAAVYTRTLRRIGGSNETLHQLLHNTTDETVRRITATGGRVLIMKSIIVSRFDPLDCLASSEYVDRCEVAFPRKPTYSDRVYEAAAAGIRRTFTFDVNRIVCPGAPRCAALIDGINVWRNVNHYSTQILRHFRTQIWTLIVRTGVLAEP
jgi:peptidoglycan/LPS O-acetylase OafA/YrhL